MDTKKDEDAQGVLQLAMVDTVVVIKLEMTYARHNPIYSGYRPSWMVHDELRDGTVVLLNNSCLAPGQWGYALLIPHQDWPPLNKHIQLRAYEGTKLVATAWRL